MFPTNQTYAIMRKTTFSALGAIVLSGLSLQAANIAWVSFHSADDAPSANAAAAGFTNAPDAGYTALLRANGHNVTRFLRVDSLQNYPDMIAALNTNDLVIASRSVPSSDFQDQAEADAWNGLTVPFITVNGYIDRGSRLGFQTGDSIGDNNSSQMSLRVLAPAHPIFAGVALDANNVMVNPYSQRVTFTNATTGVETLQNGISVAYSAIVAGGSTLATVGTVGDAQYGRMVIEEFPAGVTTYRGEVLPVKRLVFLTGSRESGITSEGAGIFDLMSDGQTLFLNAVTYMTTPQLPKCTLPLVGATNLFPGDAWTFNAGPIGDAPLSYQWYKNDQPITDATTPDLTFASLTPSDEGNYYLVLANALGRATSTVARLEFAVMPAASITNSIISYWPLDTVLGNKTPDLVSGYDMTLVNMEPTNVVAGKFGNAFLFDNASQSMLTRLHNPGDALPIYQFSDFTVSAWVQGPYQSDHRVYAECSTTNNNPMFDFGTHRDGTDGTVDIYIRDDSGATPGDHRHSSGTAWDYVFWHNIVYAQRDIGNGNMKAQLWVDGMLDPVVLYPVRPLTPNNTAIGGILRASASAWYTGLIDEVAVWNRALSPEEVGILQVTSITNPPSRLQPLAINKFGADLPAVVAGATTTLRWDVSKDATQVSIDTLGDVTAQTSVGIGSTNVTLTQTTTYVLTVNRGADTLSATTSVAVVEGVAAGWNILDDFNQYPQGNLFANGYWNDTSGNSAKVLAVNGNNAVSNSLGGGIVYLNLGNLTVTENQARTLFFRIIPGPGNASGATNIVGLTDKSQRGYGDEWLNIGPVLYAAAFTNDLIGATTNAWYLGARNGYTGGNTSNPIDYPGPALEPGVVYNVWIDITNAPLGNFLFLSDTFSVYVQKEGDSSPRTVVFQDYMSDRDPFYIDDVLGGMLPNLDKLVVMDNTSAFSAAFDDFYLSTGGYNSTVPVAYTRVEVPPGPLSIGMTGGQIEIRWTDGVLQQTSSLTGQWSDVPGNPTSPYTTTPSGSGMFYRARR